MKKIFLSILFLASITISNSQEWETFKSLEFEFKADFPGAPYSTVQNVPTDVGEIKIDMFILDKSSDVSSKNLLYLVSHNIYPEESFKNMTAEGESSVLNNAVYGSLNSVKGELLYNNEIVFNGYPGRSSKIEIDSSFVYLNIYLVYNTMYMQQVICLKDSDNNKGVNQFLNSFELIKTK